MIKTYKIFQFRKDNWKNEFQQQKVKQYEKEIEREGREKRERLNVV